LVSPRYEEVREHFEHVEFINKYMLAGLLYQWSPEDVQEMLQGPEPGRGAGFSRISYATGRAYAGQGMIVCAVK
jgi:hypothetical protein